MLPVRPSHERPRDPRTVHTRGTFHSRLSRLWGWALLTSEIGLEPQLDLRRDVERLGKLDTRATLAQVPRPAHAHTLAR